MNSEKFNSQERLTAANGCKMHTIISNTSIKWHMDNSEIQITFLNKVAYPNRMRAQLKILNCQGYNLVVSTSLVHFQSEGLDWQIT